MITFQKIIKDLKENNITIKDGNFKNMVTNFNINDYPLDIRLYLSSDNISTSCRKYIELIYNGNIDEEQYKELTYNMLIEYKGFGDFINDVKSNLNKKILEFDYTDFDSVVKFFDNFNKLFPKDERKIIFSNILIYIT